MITELPLGPNLLATDKEFRNNMHKILDKLRAVDPVIKDNVFNRWVVTGSKEIETVLRDRKRCVRDWENYAAPGTFARMMGEQIKSQLCSMGLVEMDGENHKRLRKIVSGVFSVHAIENHREKILTIIKKLLNSIKGKTHFDFIKEFAAPMPTMVMAVVLGVDEEDHQKFKTWSDQLVQCVDPAITQENRKNVADARQEILFYFADIITQRRQLPRADLITALITAEEEEGKLSTDEIITFCIVLIIAGNITTTDVLGNGLVALLKNPKQRQFLKMNPDMMRSAVEEMMRYDGPSTEIPRIAKEDFLLNNHLIKKGDTLSLMLAGANHDENKYQCPHQFNLQRQAKGHFAFGGGVHQCLGISLARLELMLAFEQVFEYFPKLKLVKEPKKKAIPTMSGFREVIVATE